MKSFRPGCSGALEASQSCIARTCINIVSRSHTLTLAHEGVATQDYNHNYSMNIAVLVIIAVPCSPVTKQPYLCKYAGYLLRFCYDGSSGDE